jgi:ribosome maturation factor RimP
LYESGPVPAFFIGEMMSSGPESPATILAAQLTDLLEPVVGDHGCELVELQFRREAAGWVLRLIVDKAGGVSLDNCAGISREVGHILEVEDLIEQAYHLEVSSPGLDRPLKRERDYIRCLGEKVKVKTREPLEGEQVFIGLIEDFSAGNLVLRTPKGNVVIPFDQISKAKLVVEI